MKGVYFKKSGLVTIVQNDNFENEDTTIQISILQVLINILSISLLSMVYNMSDYFEMQID